MTTVTDDATRLGHDVARRMRRPGPPLGRLRAPVIGSLASAARRFAAGTWRPISVRRALNGPEPVRVHRYRDAQVAPPRWWLPDLSHRTPTVPSAGEPPVPASGPLAPSAEGARPAVAALPLVGTDLPPRGLPAMVRRIPDESTWAPGGMLAELRGTQARVRRLTEVTAVGALPRDAKLVAAAIARHEPSVDAISGVPSETAPSPSVAPPAHPAPPRMTTAPIRRTPRSGQSQRTPAAPPTSPPAPATTKGASVPMAQPPTAAGEAAAGTAPATHAGTAPATHAGTAPATHAGTATGAPPHLSVPSAAPPYAPARPAPPTARPVDVLDVGSATARTSVSIPPAGSSGPAPYWRAVALGSRFSRAVHALGGGSPTPADSSPPAPITSPPAAAQPLAGPPSTPDAGPAPSQAPLPRATATAVLTSPAIAAVTRPLTGALPGPLPEQRALRRMLARPEPLRPATRAGHALTRLPGPVLPMPIEPESAPGSVAAGRVLPAEAARRPTAPERAVAPGAPGVAASQAGLPTPASEPVGPGIGPASESATGPQPSAPQPAATTVSVTFPPTMGLASLRRLPSGHPAATDVRPAATRLLSKATPAPATLPILGAVPAWLPAQPAPTQPSSAQPSPAEPRAAQRSTAPAAQRQPTDAPRAAAAPTPSAATPPVGTPRVAIPTVATPTAPPPTVGYGVEPAVDQWSAVAMPDLLTLRRTATYGAAPGRGLASGFTPVHVIRPATTTGTAAQRLPAHVESGALRRWTAGAVRPTAPVARARPDVAISPALTVAPPRLSLRRTEAPPETTAPVPGAARQVALPAPAQDRASMVAAKRTLFRSMMAGTPLDALADGAAPHGGVPMTSRPSPSADDGGVIRRVESGATNEASVAGIDETATEPQPLPTGPDLDELIDRIVERLEQRVMDELERRGRRTDRGAF